MDVVRNSAIVHGILDGVHACFTNSTDSTWSSTTGVASRLLNSLNVQCLLWPIVGAKSRLPEPFDLKESSGKVGAFSRVEEMQLMFKGNIALQS